MRRSVNAALLLLLILAVVPAQFQAHAVSGINVGVNSQYVLNRYGYATINETVLFSNNSTSSLTPSPIQIGLGNLSSYVVAAKLAKSTGAGFTMTSPTTGGPYTIQTGQALAAGGNASATLTALLNGVLTKITNGSLVILTLSSPALSIGVQKLEETVVLPESTAFISSPTGLTGAPVGANTTYSATLKNAAPQQAVSSTRAVTSSTAQDFHPLEVYQASRTITVGEGGSPVVTDSIHFKNLGTTGLTTLYVSPLTSLDGQVTVLPAAEPKLLNPTTVGLVSGAITLSSASLGNAVLADSNYTIVYQYPLQQKYYTVSGGQVTVNLPESPPIAAFVQSYALGISVPTGISIIQGPPQVLTSVSPWQNGTATMSYGLAVGWAVDDGVPAASVIFVLLLLGLFVSRSTMTKEEETEEESSTERASAMIKAFDEKTALINGLWPEIAGKDPNELSKEYFDELRGRLDSFRSKALQRLNDVKQKSTTQKFFELLNQIHATEREVDRAAKDKLNLYEQYYMRRMRKDVFDRLLPQYTKRLERALNQLSDELHVVQREAKLL